MVVEEDSEEREGMRWAGLGAISLLIADLLVCILRFQYFSCLRVHSWTDCWPILMDLDPVFGLRLSSSLQQRRWIL